MQFTKDSFYMALLQRLKSLNPQRVVTVNGTTRPAVIVAENEVIVPVDPLPDAFYLEWGAAHVLPRQSTNRPLMTMECVISHHTFGTVTSGIDRGRTLSALDMELLGICQPLWTAKRNYTQPVSVDLGTKVSWTEPVFAKVAGSQALRNDGLPSGTEGIRLERSATVNVFFFSEVNFL